MVSANAEVCLKGNPPFSVVIETDGSRQNRTSSPSRADVRLGGIRVVASQGNPPVRFGNAPKANESDKHWRHRP